MDVIVGVVKGDQVVKGVGALVEVSKGKAVVAGWVWPVDVAGSELAVKVTSHDDPGGVALVEQGAKLPEEGLFVATGGSIDACNVDGEGQPTGVAEEGCGLYHPALKQGWGAGVHGRDLAVHEDGCNGRDGGWSVD